MDLNLVSHILKKIILERGKVSLPMMGSLETEDVPAGFAKGGSIITPPSKKIVFNSFDVTNDGLLENEYAAAKGISLEESKKEVAEFVNSVKTSLIDESNYLIPGLGKIVFGADFKYSFDEDRSVNLSPDSFGLDSFKVEKNSGDSAGITPELAMTGEEKAVKIASDFEERPERDTGVKNVGAPEHEPQFAKGSKPAIDYDFGGESDTESESESKLESETESESQPQQIEARGTSSVADVYKIAPVAIAPAVKKADDTIKGTVIVDSGSTENQEIEVPEERPAVKKNAEILHFSKRQNTAENKSGEAGAPVENKEKFIPSAGVLGGHSYIFGKPLQSEATEVVVLGDNGKYEVQHAAIEQEKADDEKKITAAKSGGVDIEQSAVGAIGIKGQSENVNDVEVNVVTKSMTSNEDEQLAGAEKLSADEIELKRKLEAQEIAESEKKAEQKLWQDAQKVQMQKEKEEEARAEAERIEREKKKAEEIAERRRRGEIIEDDKPELGIDGKPRTKVVKDIEGQDESAKESIAEIFTTVAEKEANAAGAKVLGEKEAAKDWNAVKAAAGQDEVPADKIESQSDEALQKIEAQKAKEAEEIKAKSKAKAEAFAKRQKEEEEQMRAERKLRNAKILKYVKYFGYGVAAVVVLALIIYALREPLRPVLEHLLYNADELRVIHYNL
jgi:hypothetical protein